MTDDTQALLERLRRHATSNAEARQLYDHYEALTRERAASEGREDALRGLLAQVTRERDAMAEALAAEDAYWAASRSLAAALPRMRPEAEHVFSAATLRRERARAALANNEQGEG